MHLNALLHERGAEIRGHPNQAGVARGDVLRDVRGVDERGGLTDAAHRGFRLPTTADLELREALPHLVRREARATGGRQEPDAPPPEQDQRGPERAVVELHAVVQRPHLVLASAHLLHGELRAHRGALLAVRVHLPRGVPGQLDLRVGHGRRAGHEPQHLAQGRQAHGEGRRDGVDELALEQLVAGTELGPHLPVAGIRGEHHRHVDDAFARAEIHLGGLHHDADHRREADPPQALHVHRRHRGADALGERPGLVGLGRRAEGTDHDLRRGPHRLGTDQRSGIFRRRGRLGRRRRRRTVRGLGLRRRCDVIERPRRRHRGRRLGLDPHGSGRGDPRRPPGPDLGHRGALGRIGLRHERRRPVCHDVDHRRGRREQGARIGRPNGCLGGGSFAGETRVALQAALDDARGVREGRRARRHDLVG